MATLSVPTPTFTSGTAIVASQMNANFAAVVDFVNTTPGLLQLTGGQTITGAIQLNNTLTVGASGAGHDVTLHGTTSGDFLQWDKDTNKLIIEGSNAATALDVTDGNVVIGDGTLTVSGEIDGGSLDIEGDADINGTTNLDNVDIDGTINQDGVIGRIAPTGVVLPFAGGSIPTGWLLCTGGAVSRTTYANLFAVISTTYGLGDGSTTFNVPDMQGRVPAGVNTSDSNFVSLNTKVGSATHTLTSGEMPSHTHTQNAHEHQIHAPVDGGRVGSTIGTYGSQYLRNNIGDSVTQLWTAVSTTPTNQNTGGGGAHNNLQPTIALYYIIAT